MSMKQADEAALRAMLREPKEDGECACGGVYVFNDYCGAYVCTDCGDHKGLCRCYCGWAASGGDGRAELVETGETIEPEE